MVEEKNEDMLDGIKGIGVYMDRSRDTVLKLIHREGLPAKKIDGRWYSSREAIKKWLRTKVSSREIT
jgi:hypothetical protein